jgi:hypothetical protein
MSAVHTVRIVNLALLDREGLWPESIVPHSLIRDIRVIRGLLNKATSAFSKHSPPPRQAEVASP